jgi:uncharacterized protein (TIGR02266 family)
VTTDLAKLLFAKEGAQRRRPPAKARMTESRKVERRVHFRGKARAGRRVELSYAPLAANGEPASEPVAAVTTNIGVGGAFILTSQPYRIGTRLHVELRVPTSDIPISVDADVRWTIDVTQDEHGAGMGVKFHGLDVEALLRLSEYFASLTGVET